ncbi:hypothetical protein [Labedella endophytica]|uniref:Exo-alpha-sialidase n=1 Tax=Labedella endophytica TaxID=1523160 RepID=A0A433JSE2_9MICO|nr:hypothetical protein [Labedella endophytica]RUR01236.1 hypothetical protein ELQ94_06900 [Labedella endophytica]
MPKPRRHSPAREARKRWLAVIGIALFIAVDILLVVLALQSTSARDNGSTPAVVPTSSESSRPTPTASPTPTDAAPSSVTAVPPTRILAALDASVAWRATTGSCPDTAVAPELTIDGGATWSSADLTGLTGVTALQRILVTDADTATFLGSGAECDPAVARTFVGGADFAEYPDQLEGSWYLSPVGGSTVHAPGGDVAAPCDATVTVAPLGDDTAAVLCSDSSLHVTTDAGASWSTLDELPGAVALTDSADGFLVASAGSAGCAGVELTLIGVDDDRTPVDCVESSIPAGDLAGSTAIDWTDGAIWVWVDDRLLISTDDGGSWS